MLKSNFVRAACASLVLLAPMATATSAQGPIITGGLVNVTITDLIDDIVIRDINVNVNAAVQIAANVCNVAVGVIAQDLLDGDATCETAEQRVDIGPFVQ